jgi:hypothetical protein
MTIDGLAFRLGTSQRRVRQVREQGLRNPLAIREWLDAIQGENPRPLPTKFRIGRPIEEVDCGFCGCPLTVSEDGFEYGGDVFCSTDCCRKSRGWS